MQVGGELARRAKGLGMNVVAYDPYASAERAAAGECLVGRCLLEIDRVTEE